jgi:hypothetical protein
MNFGFGISDFGFCVRKMSALNSSQIFIQRNPKSEIRNLRLRLPLLLLFQLPPPINQAGYKAGAEAVVDVHDSHIRGAGVQHSKERCNSTK